MLKKINDKQIQTILTVLFKSSSENTYNLPLWGGQRSLFNANEEGSRYEMALITAILNSMWFEKDTFTGEQSFRLDTVRKRNNSSNIYVMINK